MFAVHLRLGEFFMIGFDSLDFRRKFGLAECKKVDATSFAFARRAIPVDEAFARAWFGGNLEGELLAVSHEWLLPGEIVDGQQGLVHLSPDLSMARAKELYVRARFASLERELACLKAQIARNEAEAETDDDETLKAQIAQRKDDDDDDDEETED